MKKIHATASIAHTAILESPFRPLLGGSDVDYRESSLERGVVIRDYAVIGAGCELGRDVIIDDMIKLEPNVTVGAGTLITHRAYISMGANIGNDCVIGGFLTDRVSVGNRCRLFGDIIHRHDENALGWDNDEAREESAVINDDVFIGFGALVIGAVEIGMRTYIAAGAIITKSIEQDCFAYGNNIVVKKRKPRTAENGL